MEKLLDDNLADNRRPGKETDPLNVPLKPDQVIEREPSRANDYASTSVAERLLLRRWLSDFFKISRAKENDTR